MRTTVVVPWRGGCPYRERAWTELKPRYSWPVVEAPGPWPWVKAAAVTPAVERCPDGIVILADADVWTDGLEGAVQAVEDGAPWCVPHLLVKRLTADGSDFEQRPYPGIIGGGYIVAHRDVFRSIPMDARFVGWGQEDESYGHALTTLLGPPWRGTADLTHWWHPPQERASRVRGNQDGWRLRRRYMKARTDPAAMRALVEEGRYVADSAVESARNDRAAGCVG